MFKVLFVCTGNTCRSCMAQALFNSIAKKQGLESSFISNSAGINAFEGDPASRNSVIVLAIDYGIDIGGHTARLLTKDMIADADLVLTMTRSHQKMVLSYLPEATGKVFTFMEYVTDETDLNPMNSQSGQDISDPFGMGPDTYRECAHQIEILSDKLLKKLKGSFKNNPR